MFWATERGAVTFVVRLTPKGGRDAIEGTERLADGREVLKVRVAAPPREGEANAALVRLLARTLGIAARDIHIVAGANGRIKRMRIDGEAPRLVSVLEKAAGTGR